MRATGALERKFAAQADDRAFRSLRRNVNAMRDVVSYIETKEGVKRRFCIDVSATRVSERRMVMKIENTIRVLEPALFDGRDIDASILSCVPAQKNCGGTTPVW